MARLDWTWDELVLACDLVAGNGWRELHRTDPRIEELSQLLRRLTHHPVALRDDDFRSAGSVRRKMSNLVTAHPDYPRTPTRGSHLDQAVVNAFRLHPDTMHAEAEGLRTASRLGQLDDVEPADPGDDPDMEAAEGRALLRRHLHRERSSPLRRTRIRMALAEGSLTCEVCDFDFERVYGPRGQGYIECHHVLPLHVAGERVTKVSDLALLCSNCHRMIHRAKAWLSPTELRTIVLEQRASACD